MRIPVGRNDVIHYCTDNTNVKTMIFKAVWDSFYSAIIYCTKTILCSFPASL